MRNILAAAALALTPSVAAAQYYPQPIMPQRPAYGLQYGSPGMIYNNRTGQNWMLNTFPNGNLSSGFDNRGNSFVGSPNGNMYFNNGSSCIRSGTMLFCN